MKPGTTTGGARPRTWRTYEKAERDAWPLAFPTSANAMAPRILWHATDILGPRAAPDGKRTARGRVRGTCPEDVRFATPHRVTSGVATRESRGSGTSRRDA